MDGFTWMPTIGEVSYPEGEPALGKEEISPLILTFYTFQDPVDSWMGVGHRGSKKFTTSLKTALGIMV